LIDYLLQQLIWLQSYYSFLDGGGDQPLPVFYLRGIETQAVDATVSRRRRGSLVLFEARTLGTQIGDLPVDIPDLSEPAAQWLEGHLLELLGGLFIPEIAELHADLAVSLVAGPRSGGAGGGVVRRLPFGLDRSRQGGDGVGRQSGKGLFEGQEKLFWIMIGQRF